MTRKQAEMLGWSRWAPSGGGHTEAIDPYLKPGQGEKLDRGYWMDRDDKFVCWDVDLESYQPKGQGT